MKPGRKEKMPMSDKWSIIHGDALKAQGNFCCGRRRPSEPQYFFPNTLDLELTPVVIIEPSQSWKGA